MRASGLSAQAEFGCRWGGALRLAPYRRGRFSRAGSRCALPSGHRRREWRSRAPLPGLLRRRPLGRLTQPRSTEPDGRSAVEPDGRFAAGEYVSPSAGVNGDAPGHGIRRRPVWARLMSARLGAGRERAVGVPWGRRRPGTTNKENQTNDAFGDALGCRPGRRLSARTGNAGSGEPRGSRGGMTEGGQLAPDRHGADFAYLGMRWRVRPPASSLWAETFEQHQSPVAICLLGSGVWMCQ